MPADTIVALSSPPGGSERAVIRLSGPRAVPLAEALAGPLPGPWRHRAVTLQLPGWPPIPAAGLTFRAPRSYTGEDVVELWVPGAPPLVRRLLLTLQEAGARLAERGEFTRRAFLTGRIDLTQAEAVLALTTREDAREGRAALRALAGGVRRRVDVAKQELLEVLAHVEAAIDFSEEEIDLASEQELVGRLRRIQQRLTELRAAEQRRPSAGTLPVVALRGPANAGKSTLFNRLVAGEALVSDVAGTTRDVLAAEWRLPGGRTVRLLDTAGHQSPSGEIEAQAQAAAEQVAASADLILFVWDARRGPPNLPPLPADERGAARLLVLNKADLLPGAMPGLAVSALSGQGIERLAAAVADQLAAQVPSTELFGTTRQDGLLRQAQEALLRACGQLLGRDPAKAELAAVDLNAALHDLGQLTGAVTSDDVLGEIFGSFCIGK